VPTEADFTRIQVCDVFTPVSHMDLLNDRLSIRLTNVGCQKLSSNSLLTSLAASSPTPVVIPCVNLASYDQGAEANELLQAIEYVQSISHLRTTTGGTLPIVLLLTHERDFREKLATIALARCFPKYRGGPDFQRATKYVVKRFQAVAYGYFLLPRVTAEMDVEEDIKFLSPPSSRLPTNRLRCPVHWQSPAFFSNPSMGDVYRLRHQPSCMQAFSAASTKHIATFPKGLTGVCSAIMMTCW
jgi:hypothetical protein